jgi:hypothetical protein
MTFEDVVEALGGRLGVGLTAENGVCRVDVDGMEVSMQEIDSIGGFCLLGEIGESSPLNAEAVMGSLLTANHLFAGTGGATISREPESGKFFLCRYERLDLLDGDRVVEMFGRFVDTLEIWRNTLANFRAEDAE